MNEEKKELEELKSELSTLENNENEEEYNATIDETSEVNICGMEFTPSRVLKELDPIAYSCGMNDYNDERISELQTEIEEKEAEIENLDD